MTPHEFQLTDQDRQIFDAIRACLSPDLLTPEERAKIRPDSHPVTGHCFIATLAAYRLIGMRHSLQPHFCKLSGGGTHWWLWNSETGEYLDPTFEQAAQPFPYDSGQKNLRNVKKHNRTNELVSKVTAYLDDKKSDQSKSSCQSEVTTGAKTAKPRFSGKHKSMVALVAGVIMVIGGFAAQEHATNVLNLPLFEVYSNSDDQIAAYHAWGNISVLLIVGGIVIGGIAILAIFSACPQCGAVAKREKQNYEVFGSRQVKGTKREVTTHYDRDGKKTGSSERDVPHTYTEYSTRTTYRCKSCRHTWSVNGTNRY